MAQTQEATKPRLLSTGVPNLDRVLGGGLQEHNSYLIVGASGAGKSVLAQQIAFHRARAGDRVLLITGLEEPHSNLIEHLLSFSFTDYKLIGPQIETVSLVPFLDRPLAEKVDVLRKTVLNSRPQWVIFDGLRSFEAFLDGVQGAYQFLYSLTSWFALEKITLILTKDIDAARVIDQPEFALMDGVIALTREPTNDQLLRRLTVRKMRGQSPLAGQHAFTIDHNGVTVWPRPQATFQPAERTWSSMRMPFGLPAFDPMLGGGVLAGTQTLVAGGAGTGKTMLALAFLSNGVATGQPGLWLGFREDRTQLLATTKSWGRDLEAAAGKDQLEFINLAPFELDADPLAYRIEDRVGALGAQRLVLDGASELSRALPNPDAAREFLTWLVGWLDQRGVSGLITQVPGPEARGFELGHMPLADQVGNIVLLRQAEEMGRLYRALAILKMRGSAYSPVVREFTIDAYGLHVGEPVTAGEHHPEPASPPV